MAALSPAAPTRETVRRNLRQALDLVQDCASAYRQAGSKVRRMFNQALFSHLYVRDEVTVGELREPFSTLFGVLGARPTPGEMLTIKLNNETYRRTEASPRLEFESVHNGLV